MNMTMNLLMSKEERKMAIEFKTVNEYVIKYGGDMAIKRILGDCASNKNGAKELWKEFADYMGFKIKE